MSGSRARLAWALGAGSLLLVSGGVVMAQCGGDSDVGAEPATASPVRPTNGPAIDLRGAYAQSGECAECHEEEHASWSRSFHRTMTTRASAETIKGDFEVGFVDRERRYSVSRDETGFYAARLDAQGHAQRKRVVLVTGSHHMQVYWLQPGPGDPLESFAYAYLLPERRWVLNDATLLRPPRPPNSEPTVFTWNRVCIKCHAVDGVPGLNAQTGDVRSTVAELGIACESCHGPGARHVAAQRGAAAQQNSAAVNAGLVDPTAMTARESSEVCAQCHSITMFHDEDGWLAAGRSAGPASGLSSWARLVQHPLIGDGPWLDALLATDESFIADRFWADGTVRVSGREYNGVAASPCAASDDFGCASCHEMHGAAAVDGGAWNDDQLRSGERQGASCRGCHADIAADVSAHTHHSQDNEGSNCINCHMPRTTYGLLKAMPSHRITSPTVEESRVLGRPNACNLCHLDRTLGWTETMLAQWYGQPAPEHGDEPATPIGLQWMLSGDAGQRALLAWHAGFGPSQLASRQRWLAPALIRLLRDDYLVIRIIAERSLATLDGFEDWEMNPENPAAAIADAEARWGRRLPELAPRPQSASAGTAADASETNLDHLFEMRDRRRISLAE